MFQKIIIMVIHKYNIQNNIQQFLQLWEVTKLHYLVFSTTVLSASDIRW